MDYIVNAAKHHYTTQLRNFRRAWVMKPLDHCLINPKGAPVQKLAVVPLWFCVCFHLGIYTICIWTQSPSTGQMHKTASSWGSCNFRQNQGCLHPWVWNPRLVVHVSLLGIQLNIKATVYGESTAWSKLERKVTAFVHGWIVIGYKTQNLSHSYSSYHCATGAVQKMS